jgi:predicted MFS family arabinose efflux permease
VFAAFSLGGLLGTLSHRFVKPYSPARISLVAMSFMSVFLLALPWPRDWRATLVVVFLLGAADLVAVINVINFRQEETPEDMQGRVNTTGRMLSWGLGSPIGAVTCGVVAATFGSAAGVLLAAVVMALTTVVAWTSSLGRVPARRPTAEIHL